MAADTATLTTLAQLDVGARLIVRSRKDWRHAAVARIAEARVILTVCSPTGRTYRLQREMDSPVILHGQIPVLRYDHAEDWRDNFGDYDARW